MRTYSWLAFGVGIVAGLSVGIPLGAYMVAAWG
jgi:hypothetical protein